MSLRAITIAWALCVCLLALAQNPVEAGFLSASPAPSWSELDESTGLLAFAEGAGTAPTESQPAVAPDLMAVALNAVLTGTAGGFTSGGMSSSAPEPSGSSVLVIADHAAVRPSEGPMVAWVGADGCAALPPRLSTEILRPPRSYAG